MMIGRKTKTRKMRKKNFYRSVHLYTRPDYYFAETIFKQKLNPKDYFVRTKKKKKKKKRQNGWSFERIWWRVELSAPALSFVPFIKFICLRVASPIQRFGFLLSSAKFHHSPTFIGASFVLCRSTASGEEERFSKKKQQQSARTHTHTRSGEGMKRQTIRKYFMLFDSFIKLAYCTRFGFWKAIDSC